jgi:hypothetical protein
MDQVLIAKGVLFFDRINTGFWTQQKIRSSEAGIL